MDALDGQDNALVVAGPMRTDEQLPPEVLERQRLCLEVMTNPVSICTVQGACLYQVWSLSLACEAH
jgi:hypothetical protein